MNIIGKAYRVVIGISGGVDSAVAALLLKKRGYEVLGVHMRNWDIIDETGICTVEKEQKYAEKVCSILKIPFYEVNFVREYWTEVFDDFLNDYKNGLTPNPDILCNKNIKFKYFLDFAIEKLEADAIATGHYAKVSITNAGEARLLKPHDIAKDQTFFLSQIPQSSLRKSIFPLGDMLKSEVRKIARENGLNEIAAKKESYGICFIGNRNFKTFISEYIKNEVGNFIDIDTGKIVGTHNGKHNFTLGQRCNIAGMKEPYYVAQKTDSEDLLVALGHYHPSLFNKTLTTIKPVWIHSEPKELQNSSILDCEFRFQHRNTLIKSQVLKLPSESEGLLIKLQKPLRALTPGQYAVLYTSNECLGSARIRIVGHQCYKMVRRAKS